MAKIVLSAVSLIRRGVEALRDVSFEVPDGAFCVLTGPTGAGKSTLLRLIAAREAPTGGVIEVGDAVSRSWRLGRPEAVEFSDAASLSPRRNVYDTMIRGLRRRGFGRAEAEARTLRAADAMGLGALMARRLDRVSSGEAARAVIGRALAHRPGAILLDEPFAGLDAARRIEARRALKRLQAEQGATIVLATHDWTDALALADLIVVLDQGRVVASGPPGRIFDAPETVALARLTGAPPMNVLPVRANQTGLSLEDGTHLGGASVMTAETFALLGVRPESLFVADSAAPAAAVFPVAVEQFERAGAETFVHGRVGPHPFVARVGAVPDAPASGRIRLGARRDSLHMFDARTGARLSA